MSKRLPRLSARLNRAWVDVYTRGLSPRARAERRQEVYAEIVETERRASAIGPARASARTMSRMLRGIPADLGWRLQERRPHPRHETALLEGKRRMDQTKAVVSLPRRISRPRGPGVTHAAITILLLLFVAAVSLTARQSTPPTIAEFAPRAVEQIAESSADPAGTRGGMAGASSADDASSASSVTPQTVDVARARRCVGDPPRQIEDPQSPPCVPYWSGDNGGATSRGVTRDEIRLVNPANFHTGPALAAFFNKRFELYGRQIRLIVTPPIPQSNPPAQRAAARSAYEQEQAFASISPAGWSPYYFDELARLGVIGSQVTPDFPEPYLAARRPYVWTYTMANDRLFATAGNWYCARFGGRNAVHAGEPVLQMTRRKAGILLFTTDAELEQTSTEPLNDQLATCGDRTDAVIHDIGARGDTAFMENAMLQMKSSGVTTVFFLGDACLLGPAMRAATNQAYFPEWLVTDYLWNEGWWLRFCGDPGQMKNMMMLLASPMERAQPDHPSNWASQEITGAGHSSPTGLWNTQWSLDFEYRQLLLLASGFQMAGPHLTPATFERGLHRTRFPNPAHRIMAGAVGFDDGDHSMTDDAAEIWWSTTTRGPIADGTVGSFCYVDHGARRRMGSFPADDPFFRGPCDNGSA